MLKRLFDQDAAQVFDCEFCEIFWNIYFAYDYRMLYEVGVLKHLAKFKVKFK